MQSFKRRVIRTLAAGLVAWTGACADEPPGDPEVVVGFIASQDSRGISAQRGAALGAEEAAHAGELIGRRFILLTEEADSPAELEAAAERMREQGAIALVGGFDTPSCTALMEIAERHRVIFLNIGCPADAFRNNSGRFTFHVEAADSLYRAARATATASAADPADSLPVLWHAGLSRYGAAQLNDRFLAQSGTPTDAPGWAAWMAMKIVWEAALRTAPADPVAIAAFLSSQDALFDGHKGEQLRFDPITHQLLQPLYLADRATLASAQAQETASMAPSGEIVPLTGNAYAFVSNEGSGDVSVIDLDSGREVSRIAVGARPRGIHLSPDGAFVFVALSDDAPATEGDGDAIAAISIREGTVVARHPAGTDPEQFALSPDGRHLYAANEDAGTASITDLESGEILTTLVVGIEPEGVAVSPDGRWVYVTAETSNTVSVIDTERNEVIASFLVDIRPRGVTFSPDGRRAYVTCEISGTLVVIDTDGHAVIASIPLGEGRAKPVGVEVSPDGSRVYVANGHGHSVSVIDTASNQLLGEVVVGRRPWGIAVSPDGNRIYTANGASNDVSVIDAASLRVVGTVPVGERPWGITVLRGGPPAA